MTELRFAFLNAAHGDDNTRRNFRRELDAELVEFDATAGHLPETVAFDAVIVSGSRSSVYGDEEWIDSLKAWVGDAIDAGLPALGICYGHQLLASVLGGDVADMGEYEIGYREIERTGQSMLLSGIDDRFLAFTTHSDEVVSLPPGAELLAENDYSIHAFRKGDVFGVQFHPEYDVRTAREVTEGKELPEDRIRTVLDGIHAENYGAACESKALFDNFCAYVRASREEAGRAAAD